MLESAQKELGTDAIVVSSDARSLTDLDALASRSKAELDTLDLLFVNAGFSTQAPLESITEAIYDEMFPSNRKAALSRARLSGHRQAGRTPRLTTSTCLHTSTRPRLGPWSEQLGSEWPRKHEAR
jgi:NAD(P)-dependent dehydrogenase (short-subunit alcohol dehydrogenase family)